MLALAVQFPQPQLNVSNLIYIHIYCSFKKRRSAHPWASMRTLPGFGARRPLLQRYTHIRSSSPIPSKKINRVIYTQASLGILSISLQSNTASWNRNLPISYMHAHMCVNIPLYMCVQNPIPLRPLKKRTTTIKTRFATLQLRTQQV